MLRQIVWRKSMGGKFHELNVGKGLFVGGLGDFTDLFLGFLESFRGCLEKIFYNGIDVISKVQNEKSSAKVVNVEWRCAQEFDAPPAAPIYFSKKKAYVSFEHPFGRTGGEITLEIRTLSKNALVLYNSGPPSTYSADEVIKQHVQTARNVSVEVKAKYHTRVDIPYLQKPRTKLDIVGEDLPDECQVVMYVHGGYWQELSKELSFLPSGSFYDEGILTIIVGYTLAPTAKFSEIIEEIRAALLWSVNYCWKRGSKGLFLMGWSAGGHLLTEVLSSMPAKTDLSIEVLKGVITLAGVFDVRPIVATYVNDSLQLTEKEAWNLSPMRKTQELSQSFPMIKMLISVGENDSPEFKRQSLQYCEEMRRNKMTAKYKQVPSVDHFDLVEKLSNPDFTLTRKLIDFVKTQ